MQRGKTRPGEKTPGHLGHLATLLSWYPLARVVCLVRDGRDVALSKARAPWAANDPRMHAVSWVHRMQLLRSHERSHPDRVLRVYFEKLVADPEGELRRIDAFLGVPFEPGQLEASRATGVVRDFEASWKGKVDEEVDAKRGQAWKRSASPEQRWLLNVIMGRTLRELGYDETRLAGCSAWRRVRYLCVGKAYAAAFHPRVHPQLLRIKRLLSRAGLDFDLFADPELDVHDALGERRKKR